jgi:hypothetical protein
MPSGIKGESSRQAALLNVSDNAITLRLTKLALFALKPILSIKKKFVKVSPGNFSKLKGGRFSLKKIKKSTEK